MVQHVLKRPHRQLSFVIANRVLPELYVKHPLVREERGFTVVIRDRLLAPMLHPDSFELVSTVL
jgi:hypothetical protein